MVTATGERQKRAKGRPRSDRNDVPVKVDAGVVAEAKHVAQLRGISLAEYITELIRNPVRRDYIKEVKKIVPVVDAG